MKHAGASIPTTGRNEPLAARGAADFGRIVEVARASLGQDREGYRAEFIQLVERARGIDLAQAADRG